jgi:hypothetical protein
LLSDDNVVIKDLDSVSAQSQASLPQWGSRLLADGLKATAQGDIVRSDLGLPPS